MKRKQLEEERDYVIQMYKLMSKQVRFNATASQGNRTLKDLVSVKLTKILFATT